MRRSLATLFAVVMLAAAVILGFLAHVAGAQGPPTGSSGPGATSPRPQEPRPGEGAGHGPPQRPFEWNQARAETTVMMMLEHIKGQEDMPAESVYKNIKILKGFPARRLPGIMVMGFSRSLGMRCGGCHVHDDFPNDSLANKRIAREMWGMVQNINTKVLPSIKDIDVKMPMVNCWTCHRGQHEPETNPDAPKLHDMHGQEAPKPESSH